MKKHKVLLFKDEHLFSDLLTKVIRGLGHEVLILDDPTACSAFSSEGAICTKDTPCADVLLTHCQMVNASGIELFQMQSTHGCKVPITNKALMASDESLKELPSVVNLGCTFLTKPFGINELEIWLNECFERGV